jgi:hypothetical protein
MRLDGRLRRGWLQKNKAFEAAIVADYDAQSAALVHTAAASNLGQMRRQ